MSNPDPTPITLTNIPVKVVGLPGYTDEFDATLILEITRPTDGVHFSVVEAPFEGKTETVVVPSVCVEKPPSPPLFDLFVTTPQGRTFKTMRSPYPSREEMRRTVRIQVTGTAPAAEVAAFADSVLTAPLGVPVTHGATGITLRTEYTEYTEETPS